MGVHGHTRFLLWTHSMWALPHNHYTSRFSQNKHPSSKADCIIWVLLHLLITSNMVEKISCPSGTLAFGLHRPDTAETEASPSAQHAKDKSSFSYESTFTPGYSDSLDISTKPVIEQKLGSLSWRPLWPKRGLVNTSDVKKENDGLSTSPIEQDEGFKSSPGSTTSESYSAKKDSFGLKRYSPKPFNRQFVKLSDSFHSIDSSASPTIHTPSSRPYNAVHIWDKNHISRLQNATLPQSELSAPELKVLLAKAISTRPRLATLRDMTSDHSLKKSCKIIIAHVDGLHELNRKYFGLWDMKHFPLLEIPIMEEYGLYATKLMKLQDSVYAPEMKKEYKFWHEYEDEDELGSVSMASTYRVALEPHPRPKECTWKPAGIRKSDNDWSYERLESHMLEGKLFDFPKNEIKESGNGENEGGDETDGNRAVKDNVSKLDEE